MSKTFIVTKTGMASPSEVDRLKELWTGNAPRWYVRLWMFVHRWHAKPMVSIVGRSFNEGSSRPPEVSDE